MPHPNELILGITQRFPQAEQAGLADEYAALAGLMSDATAQLREHVQTTMRHEVLALINKLRGSGPLTPAEHASLRLWIVGDADHYTQVEQDFPNWLQELKRIVQELATAQELTPQTAFRLRALLNDGLRVAWDIHHYLEHKERIERFTESTEELDREERSLLAELLLQKLNSDKF